MQQQLSSPVMSPTVAGEKPVSKVKSREAARYAAHEALEVEMQTLHALRRDAIREGLLPTGHASANVQPRNRAYDPREDVAPAVQRLLEAAQLCLRLFSRQGIPAASSRGFSTWEALYKPQKDSSSSSDRLVVFLSLIEATCGMVPPSIACPAARQLLLCGDPLRAASCLQPALTSMLNSTSSEVQQPPTATTEEAWQQLIRASLPTEETTTLQELISLDVECCAAAGTPSFFTTHRDQLQALLSSEMMRLFDDAVAKSTEEQKCEAVWRQAVEEAESKRLKAEALAAPYMTAEPKKGQTAAVKAATGTTAASRFGFLNDIRSALTPSKTAGGSTGRTAVIIGILMVLLALVLRSGSTFLFRRLWSVGSRGGSASGSNLLL